MTSNASSISIRDVRSQLLWVVTPIMITYVLLCLRDAWIADDAYITLRSARNWIEYFEPNFNLGIRTQAFTSTTWHAVVAALYGILPNGYLVLLSASLVTATATTALLLYRVVPRDSGVAPVLLLGSLLLSSRSYVDYSTSGMENGLLHLMVAVLYLFWNRQYDPHDAASSRIWSRNILLTSIALVMTRLDHAPLALPFAWAAVTVLWRHFKPWPLCRRLLLYGSPLLLWKAFSIVYYGSLLPNSALSKLSHGQPIGDMLGQGLGYLYSSFLLDPVLVITLLVAVVVGWFSPRGRSRVLAIAIVLQLATCVWVGGDFMAGRFLTASFVLAAIVIAREVVLTHSPTSGQLVAVVAVVGLSLLGTRPVWTSSLEGGRKPFDARGIVDEAGMWSLQTGFWRVGRDFFLPVGHRRDNATRFAGPGPYFGDSIGIETFYGNPRARVFDAVALVDPLLSRMPSLREPWWRIGHFTRMVPKNHGWFLVGKVKDYSIGELQPFAERVRNVTTGPFWDRRRFLDAIALSFSPWPRPEDVSFDQLFGPIIVVDWPGAEPLLDQKFDALGIVIRSPRFVTARKITLSVKRDSAPTQTAPNAKWATVYFVEGGVERMRVRAASANANPLETVIDLEDGVRGRFDGVAIRPADRADKSTLVSFSID